MSKASKDYQKLIEQLNDCKTHCEQVSQEGVDALQEAMDIIHDYESVVASHNRMVEHYETAAMTIKRQAGIYVCPNCGKRVQVGHGHCHWCGKKVQWDKEAYESRNAYMSNRGGRS